MRITVVGRGNLGGGLADLWERAGHEVTRLGRDGGDVSDADAVLVAVPGGAIAEAFDGLRGVEGKTMIDATNLPDVAPPEGFVSNVGRSPHGFHRSFACRPARHILFAFFFRFSCGHARSKESAGAFCRLAGADLGH